MASAIPAHTFVEPWNPLSCRCKLGIGGETYDVVRWTMPVRIVRYTARKNGIVVAERAKFTSLLRDLGKRPSPTPSSTEGA